VTATYPEIGDFFARYVQDAQPLPLAEYFGKVGIRYQRLFDTGKLLPSLGFSLTTTSDGIYLTQLTDSARAFGFRDGDVLVRALDQEVRPENMREVLSKLKAPGVGKPYEIAVRHQEPKEIVMIKGRVQQRHDVKNHYFAPDPAATPDQLALRAAWMKNL
jgi:predicted metalloprotease with PDZ domain